MSTPSCRAASVGAALASLEEMATPEDALLLRAFYNHFEPGWRKPLAERAAFADRAEAFRDELSGPRVSAYLRRVSDFFVVDIDRDFKAFFVWWPPIDRTGADVGGRVLPSAPADIGMAEPDRERPGSVGRLSR